ncbi:CoA ester lyase [Paraconexibacter antarcticus]|uniref:CoA ester lyase n=1 Tax=Paraconexibacter antarcticus TaxID=2949664 RepID=A0ABY5DZ44_9ACTN|nr:CoA ester lyase [Paraconexibacter antarcticus]UTI66224.1 CoA ester lyase [Paraconexibacter antarcticus]
MLRSLLFAPATRPDLVAKLPRSRPDAVIIDLEDAVPAAHKVAARVEAVAGAAALVGLPNGPRVYVRVNAVDTPWFAEDVATALAPGVAGIVVPKVESVAGLQTVRDALLARGGPPLSIIAGFESGRGVLEVEPVLAGAAEGPVVEACYFGAEDYAADIGARRTVAGDEVLYARSRVALASAVHSVLALDQVVVAIGDDERFLADAERGRDLGYRGKTCIHPGQVPLANRVFSPSEEELSRSVRMLATWQSRTQDGHGALLFEGRMVDEPAIREARALLATAEAIREGGRGRDPAA